MTVMTTLAAYAFPAADWLVVPALFLTASAGVAVGAGLILDWRE